MDFALLSLIITTLFSVAALAVAVYGLEEGRRTSLLRWAKSWTAKIVVIGMVCVSAYGVLQFVGTAGPASRPQIFMFAIHIFNALAIGFIVFLEATGKALEQRGLKRKELEATVAALKARLDSLAP